MTAHQPWQEVAAAYRAEVDGRIPKEWRLPASITDTILEKSNQVVLDIPRTCGPQTAEELDITENYDAAALAQLLAKETFTSVAVTTAFCKRAAIAQQLVRSQCNKTTHKMRLLKRAWRTYWIILAYLFRTDERMRNSMLHSDAMSRTSPPMCQRKWKARRLVSRYWDAQDEMRS